MTLTEFLLARIEETEAWANACEGLHWEWAADHNDETIKPDPLLDAILDGGDGFRVSLRSVETFPYQSIPGEGPRFFVHTDEVRTAAAGHIIRHDPARVLADCAAKREVIDWVWGYEFQIDGEWGTSRSIADMQAAQTQPEALRALASVYSDHPDYQQEWKP